MMRIAQIISTPFLPDFVGGGKILVFRHLIDWRHNAGLWVRRISGLAAVLIGLSILPSSPLSAQTKSTGPDLANNPSPSTIINTGTVTASAQTRKSVDTNVADITTSGTANIASGIAPAQTQVFVGVNLADFLALGTLNIEAGAEVTSHISLNASARFNPWTFRKGDPDTQAQYRHQTYSAGLRWWPSQVFSGWWLGASGQYRQYNRGGFIDRTTEEGDAWGATLGGGYALPLRGNLLLDFGASLFGGYALYTTYACPLCGRETDSGTKWFVLPSSLIASLVWLF